MPYTICVCAAITRILILCVASINNRQTDAGGEQRGDGLHPREFPRQQRLGLDPRLVFLGERYVGGVGDDAAGGAAPSLAARRCGRDLMKRIDR